MISPPNLLTIDMSERRVSEERWNLSRVIKNPEGMIAEGIAFVVSRAGMIIPVGMIEKMMVKI